MHIETFAPRPRHFSPITAKTALRKLAVLACVATTAYLGANAQAFKVANIISDGSVPATTTDANFINPWAISASSTWWINAQATGFSYVVPAAGTISFKVIVPAASGVPTATGLPAGIVTTAGASSGMLLPSNATKASFIFSTLDGTIAGWNSKLGTANAVSQIVVNNSSAGASYPGLAMLTVSGTSDLLAANFGTGNAIEVYDSAFKPAKLAGSFVDPTLPAGYSPFSVHVIGTQVFVAYALRSTAAPFRTVNGSGNGAVSIFDTAGNFVARAVTGGNLNAPWGVAIAPASFGIFSGDLLIGNFGDGLINVYDPKTYSYLGQLMDATGKPLAYASLWELLPGGTAVAGTTAVSAGDTSTVYFTAGLAGETHGLFGGISNGTTTGSTPTFGFSAGTGTASVTAGSSAQAIISVAPANAFAGTVTLACSGLPVGATCTFSPTQLSVAATASSTATVTIQTTKATAALEQPHVRRTHAVGITSALLLPFASVLIFRRRRTFGNAGNALRLLGVLLVFVATSGVIVGCSDNGMATPIATPTPAGTSTVVVTATSGAISQQASIALTVK
jgi:uncharacterized protein (TIGR03118 family)